MDIRGLLGRLPLILEVSFSAIALATEQYWLFWIVGIAAGYDAFAYYAKKRN